MIRVFPRKTKATPCDDKVFFGGPPLFPLEDRDVHISVTFTWDKPKAEWIATQWQQQDYKVSIGGPAYDDRGGEFVPGQYLKAGYTITSRGCNNKCWFCPAWRREGNIRELYIRDGWRVMDNNLLQCSEEHIRRVFIMLQKQPIPVGFFGGLEAKILKDWHIDLLTTVRLSRCYFAYDTENDYEPLVVAAQKIFACQTGFTKRRHIFGCYVLIGYAGDTISAAENRLQRVKELGFVPFAMLYKDDKRMQEPNWITFQSRWANPTKIYGSPKFIHNKDAHVLHFAQPISRAEK